MNFLEKDLENIIWESDNERLQEKNLPIYGKKYRQLKIGSYGILDLLTVKKRYWYSVDDDLYIPYLDITVYELKKEKVGVSTFLQAVRYVKGIKSYLEEKHCMEAKYNIVLCAKEVDIHSSFIFLVDLIMPMKEPNNLLNSISAFSFDYTLDGIVFKKHEGYDLINKGF